MKKTIKMKNKLKTKNILAVVIVLNFILVGAYTYAFYMVKEKNKSASKVSGELEQYLSKEGVINLVKKSVKDTTNEREKLNSYFVSRDDIVKFTKKIESLGEIAGVNLTIMGLRTQGNILFFDISSWGSFRNLLHLVSLLENLPFKVDVKKAYIDKAEAPPGKEDVGVSGWEGNFTVKLVGFTGK
jgi:hypothetical protein